MAESKITRIISWSTIVLVLSLAIGAFVLSYIALYDVAIKNGIPAWAAWIWPLLIDAAIVIFSIGIVRAYLKKESPGWQWAMVVVFTGFTLFFNLVHAGGNPAALDVLGWSVSIKYIVGGIAPVALVLAFETATGMIRSEIRRATVAQTVQDMAQSLESVQSELDIITDKITDRQTELDNITRQIQEKQDALKSAGRQPVVILGTEPDSLRGNPGQRQMYLAQMINQMRAMGVEDTDIQETAINIFNISAKTFDRDVKELNGQVQ